MGTLLKVLDFILKWVLPFGVAGATFIAITYNLEEKYRRSNLDLFWKKVIRWTIVIGLVALIISFIVHTPMYDSFNAHLGQIAEFLKTKIIIGTIISWFQIAHIWVAQKWAYWSLVYGRAFAFIFVFGAFIEGFALKWRLSFWRAFNVFWPIVLEFPFLIFKYFQGYQTPVQDKVLAGILKAKLRENLNDSYEDLDRGTDVNGNPINDGAGGTVQRQTRSAVNQAMKHTKVTVRTAADGQRIAHVLIKQSRETETDRAIEQVMKGWGERVSGNSIYFPSDPTYSNEEKGYILDSIVNFWADEELGSYNSNFPDPLAEDNKVSNGGDGPLATFATAILNSFYYFLHLTPYALYLRHKRKIDNKYYRDTSAEKAKYKVMQNLDLSVIPNPTDPATGRSIGEQKKLALQKAKSRIPDVTTALNSFGLYGKFKDVQVSGSTAIYSFTLPPDSKIPNDFDKVQNKIGNILRINEKPIITLRAGILSVSMNTGVNIPVSFTDMIKKRPKGTSSLISGVIGEDAMGKPLTFELGDSTPHCIIFGKTGTGKSVLIESLLYTIMSGTTPDRLRIIYIDGKGNSFEFMKNDGGHPNPFTFTQPADASGDMDYARALIIWLEKECRRRIELFKKAQVAKLSEYNEKQEAAGKKILPELLVVNDEFSAITQQDKQLAPKDFAKYNVVDRFEYLAKMARSVGIRMILANQSARKVLVPGPISANIPARISLGVSDPAESELALPETGIKVNLISKPGEFYSLMHGPQNPEHGNGPYLPQKVMNRLNDELTRKFGQCKYVKTREQIFAEAGLSDANQENNTTDTVQQGSAPQQGDSLQGKTIKYSEIKKPDKAPTSKTGFGIIKSHALRDINYALYVKANEDEIIDHNVQMYTHNQKMKEIAQDRATKLKAFIDRILEQNQIKFIDDRKPEKAHPHQGSVLAKVINGENKVL